MKPRRVLQVTRQLNYGCAVVLDQLTRSLDRKRYESIIVFETHEQSTIRQNLTESNIKTIDLKKPNSFSADRKQILDKALNISELLNRRFSKKTADAYLALKSAYRFALHQAPRVRPFLKLIRDNQIDLVHTHSNLSHANPEVVAALISGKPCVAHTHAYMEPTLVDRFLSKLVSASIYISNDVAEHHYV